MPYKIKKVARGYKVCKARNPKKCFSNHPLPLARAKKQMTAINISEHKKLF